MKAAITKNASRVSKYHIITKSLHREAFFTLRDKCNKCPSLSEYKDIEQIKECLR